MSASKRRREVFDGEHKIERSRPPRIGKLVHLPDHDADTHAKLKAYCEAQRLDMKSFVSGLIVAAVRRGSASGAMK